MRLISFGCSHTQGQGIIKETNDIPCDSSWSGQLANLLEVEHVNTARSAASNFEIHNTIRNFNFKEKDMAVILFSYFTRDIIYEETSDSIRIIPVLEIPDFVLKHNNDPRNVNFHKKVVKTRKDYYTVHNDFDLLKSNFIAVHNIYNELKNKNVICLCRFSVLPIDDTFKIHAKKNTNESYEKLLEENWNEQFLLDLKKPTLKDLSNQVEQSERFGFDGMHSSYKVHSILANEYYKEITNMA